MEINIGKLVGRWRDDRNAIRHTGISSGQLLIRLVDGLSSGPTSLPVTAGICILHIHANVRQLVNYSNAHPSDTDRIYGGPSGGK